MSFQHDLERCGFRRRSNSSSSSSSSSSGILSITGMISDGSSAITTRSSRTRSRSNSSRMSVFVCVRMQGVCVLSVCCQDDFVRSSTSSRCAEVLVVC